ncbi:MAG: right-handed parallel beta-helix repeat-containing protein [Deltaproteobacteria bacterium]|nr:right-handed parallel beta-helix repeat-containing protein [Deltaproteobacteria bacterium]
MRLLKVLIPSLVLACAGSPDAGIDADTDLLFPGTDSTTAPDGETPLDGSSLPDSETPLDGSSLPDGADSSDAMSSSDTIESDDDAVLFDLADATDGSVHPDSADVADAADLADASSLPDAADSVDGLPAEDLATPDAIQDSLTPDGCTATCAGKQCGDDGCGGSCGSCGANQQCSADGKCVCAYTACGGGCCGDKAVCLDSTCRDCTHLASLGDAGKNATLVESCLSQWKLAALDAGTFPVAHGITLPAGSHLKGNGTSHPVLELAQANQTNFLVTVTDGARVSDLTLDGMNHVADANGAVVHVVGSEALVDGNIIRNKDMPPIGLHTTGIYFIGAQGKNSKATGNEIYNCFYGVIFAWMLDAAHPNTVEKTTIRDIRCDSITLAGYGRAVGNTIYQNGWDCENGPIPGGGIYCLDNVNGGEILDNDIHDNCGMNIDIDRCSGLVIKGNHAWNPGYRWDGWSPWCHGPASLSLVDSSNFAIESNVVENNDRPSNNFVGQPDWNGVFGKKGAGAFSDLPSGSKQTIAFVLARRPNAAQTATGSTIKNNEFRSFCAPASQCVGLGYFASRNTGYAANGDYTPNFYTGNNPFGSQIGSKRCGGNWYAADSVCDEGSPAPCNGDDFQHNPPVGDWARNDKCNWY